MKKIVGVILLALVLTLAMAVPVMADGDTGVTVDIVEPTIAVDAPSDIILGSSVVQGGTYYLTGSSTTDGAVSCNSPQGFTVTMSRDFDRMQGSPPLTQPFYAQVDGGGWVGTTAATTVLDRSGATSGAETFTLDVKQDIVPADASGNYRITITFAGTCK